MKIRNPKNRYLLNIKRNYKVLEIGGGHNPHPRANVVVDKFIENNAHRGGDIKLHKGQQFIQADGENLPFEDKEFDYVICCHVLEHVDNPARFIQEMTRVAKRGYVETPSLMGEYLAPKYSHQWVILEIGGRLVFKQKSDMEIPEEKVNFGDFFLYYMNSQSLPYKLFYKTNPNVFTVRVEWADQLDCLVNPEQDNYLKYFDRPWDLQMLQEQFPQKSVIEDFGQTVGAFARLMFTHFLARVNGQASAGMKQIGLGEIQKAGLAS